MFESNFRSSLEISRTDFATFFTRPISIVLWILIILVVAYPFVQAKIVERNRMRDKTRGSKV